MADPIHLQILDHAASRIIELNLEGIGDRVHVVQIGDDEAPIVAPELLPAVLICPFGTEEIAHEYNNCDDINFPVFVIFLDNANKDTENRQKLANRLGWRELVRAKMHRVGMLRTPAGQGYEPVCSFETIVDVSAWFDKAKYASALRITAQAKKVPRTRG
jgi:hypothetical protein